MTIFYIVLIVLSIIFGVANREEGNPGLTFLSIWFFLWGICGLFLLAVGA